MQEYCYGAPGKSCTSRDGQTDHGVECLGDRTDPNIFGDRGVTVPYEGASGPNCKWRMVCMEWRRP